jgi:tetratricopeptide (TPR) repeat protein
MLFDLRGRGRRRTVQAIYLSLAVLMGGGLVFFGIGGNTSGGLFDAINGSGSGSGSSVDKTIQKRVDTLNERVRINPQDQRSLVTLARVHYQIANTGEGFNQTQNAFTAKGLAELRQAASAWERYLALNPAKPDASTANLMVSAYGEGGLKKYDKAVQAVEIAIDSRPTSAGLYAQLAVYASAANQTRKSELAEQKALALSPKAQRKQLKSQIDLAKSQLSAQPAGQPSPSG